MFSDEANTPVWTEAAGLGIATADQGIDSVALMGLSAARIHGAIPRGLAVAVVATTRHRPTLHLADRGATVHFARRRVPALDVQHQISELGQGWVTTIEQTRSISPPDPASAACQKKPTSCWPAAIEQRRQASLARLCKAA